MMECRILIVEDDLISGKILEKIIQKLGFISLGIVPNAEAAFLAIKKDLPDLVFMDIGLSGIMDGIYTAEVLSGYYNIPVIFVTSHADAATISSATKIGVGYIIKPFLEQDIMQAIEIVLHKNNNKTNSDTKEERVKLLVRKDENIIFLDFRDIYFFEAHGHKISLYTQDNMYCIRGSLDKFKKMDKAKLFLRCHKSFLVNIQKIDGLICLESYHYQIRIKDLPNLIPISRTMHKPIKQFLS